MAVEEKYEPFLLQDRDGNASQAQMSFRANLTMFT